MDVQQEVRAKLLRFDANELRWSPCEGTKRIELCRSVSKGTRLTLGEQSVALSDVIAIANLTPVVITIDVRKEGLFGLRFDDEASAKDFSAELSKRKGEYERMDQFDANSVQSYFQYYAKLGNQQNMLQDAVRTSTYRRAIVENPSDFAGLAAMDIGAGSGILSFFAAQTGAKTVYAVEASSMGEVIRELADTNTHNFPGSTIKVVNKQVEKMTDEDVPEKVDVLVSEPIGTFLFNERMIESYLYARDRFLKPGGKMFPNVGNLCIAPFSDTMLHWEQQNKNGFWKNTSFYGLDLTVALKRCTKEHFCQPIVDYVNPDCLVAAACVTRFDFQTISIESLHKIDLPFDFEINQPCLIHGIAGWFDALFEGSTTTVTLSTAPWSPGTHWYQIRFLLETPLAVNAGQHVTGHVRMEANNLQSYYVEVSTKIAGTNISSNAPRLDLKDPEYRFYTSPNAYCPPGTTGVFGQQGTQQQGAPPQIPPISPAQGQTAQNAQGQHEATPCQVEANGHPATNGQTVESAQNGQTQARNKKRQSPPTGAARM
jgi:histone-arginine methyltransferase CARM1